MTLPAPVRPRTRIVRKTAPSLASLTFLLAALLLTAQAGRAQSGFILFGDLKVDESKVEGQLPSSFQVVLHSPGGRVIGRETVPPGGRYRFMGLAGGEYDLAVEVDNKEVVRMRVSIGGSIDGELRQDLELEWRSDGPVTKSKPGAISAADMYQRAGENQALFSRAQSTLAKKSYEDAAGMLRQLVAADPKDFQAWAELGTAYFLLEKMGEAENAYKRALGERPKYAPAQLNLGRVLIAQKRYEDAMVTLTELLQQRNDMADGYFLMGEIFLQLKKGSKAVPFLNEAARLGQADAHLRLATLYNAAGLKTDAAAEYEQFLKKRPDYPDRKKLEKYIAEQKKKP